MSRSIFLVRGDEELFELQEKPYGSEDLLQRLLAKFPNLLPGEQINHAQPRRWLLISREVGVPDQEEGSARWALDHLLLDQEAVPTLVEAKRSSDTRTRREVVAQMLDYAANAVAYWSIERLQGQFAQTCQKQGADPEQDLLEFLGDSDEPGEFWKKAKTNLQAGRIRMIFVADQIPLELQRIVEFLNEQMDPAEVLAVEIRQFTGEGVRTLVPTLIGQTVEAQQKKGASGPEKRQWDEESFFAELEQKRPPAEARVAHEILQWAKSHAMRVSWGNGKMGSFVLVLEQPPHDYKLFTVYNWSTSTFLDMNFGHYAGRPPFTSEEKRLELMKQLNDIDGVSLSEDRISKHPSINLSVFAEDSGRLEHFFKVYEWFIEEVRGGSA